MKKINQLFAFVLITSTLLSFIVPNNFTQTVNHTISAENESTVLSAGTMLAGDTLSFVALNRMLTKELLKPLRDCFEKSNPDMFMTKCFTRIEFRLSPDFMDRVLYKGEIIEGSVILNDCSTPIRIADLVVDFKRKTIDVKESYRTPFMSHKTFLKDFYVFLQAK